MVRYLFHALIALTLALNGFSAPLAMAHMDHGTPAVEAPEAPPALAAQQKHPCHEVVADDKATESLSAIQMAGVEGEPAGKSCCESDACHCGCVLSLAVPFVHLAPGAQAITATPVALIAPPPALLRGTPPFRPPAA